MSSRFTVDTNILRIRDVFAINPQNSQFIQPGEIPMIGSNGQLRWYSSLEFFSSISVPTASTSVLGILLSVPEGLSSLSTAITTVTNDTVTSTVRGLGSADYVSTSYLENVIVLLSQDRKYISATTLYDVIANLGNLPWIGDNGGPMALLGSNFAQGSGYISTFSLFSTVAGLGSLGYLSTGGISFQMALASTVVGLGTVGYVSTAVTPLQLQSTVEGLGTTGFISTLDGGISIPFIYTSSIFASSVQTSSITTVSIMASTISTYSMVVYGNSTLTVEGGFFTSTLNLRTPQGTYAPITISSGYLTVDGLIPSTIYSVTPANITSTVAGLGSSGYVSSSGLASTVDTLLAYISSFIDPAELTSTVVGLAGNQYLSTSGLTSTVTGLGQFYISSSGLVSTTSNIVAVNLPSTIRGLGTSGYVSSTQLFSTTNNIVASNLPSTVAGLGQLGYISSASAVQSGITSSIAGLGTSGYVSSTQLFSTTNNIVASNLPSTVAGLGQRYVSSLINVVSLSTQQIQTSSLSSFYINTGSINFTNILSNGTTWVPGGGTWDGATSTAIVIGCNAAVTNQGTAAIAIGCNAGNTNQGAQSIAIGRAAGFSNQSTNSIAIGWLAGSNTTAEQSIILNASGSVLNTSNPGFYVNPTRFYQAGCNALSYNQETGEIYQTNQLLLSSLYIADFTFISAGMNTAVIGSTTQHFLGGSVNPLLLIGGTGAITENMFFSYNGTSGFYSCSNSPFNTQLNKYITNGKVALAVGYGDTTIAYSSNGINWHSAGTPIETQAYSGIWDSMQNRFIVVGDGTNKIVTSKDGVTWTSTTAPGSSAYPTSIAAGVPPGTTIYYYYVGMSDGTLYRSTNLSTWTSIAIYDNLFIYNIKYVNGYFFVFYEDFSNPPVSYSASASSFQRIDNLPMGTSPYYDVAHDGTTYVFVGANGTNQSIAYTTNFINVAFTYTTTPDPNDLYAIVWDRGQFFASGAGGVFSSTDGATWTTITYQYDAAGIILKSLLFFTPVPVLFANSTNVGVLCNSPRFELDVNGIINASSTLFINGSSLFTYIGSTVRGLGTSGYLSSGSNSIAIGYNAGAISQQLNAIAIGTNGPGYVNQGVGAIAIGYAAGYNTQGSNAIAIGNESGSNLQGTAAIAIGLQAGYSNQAISSIAIGNLAMCNAPSSIYGVAIGAGAGMFNTTIGASKGCNVAIGYNAGFSNQDFAAIAIGLFAGSTMQSTFAVAIGSSAGQSLQARGGIAIGDTAGNNTQGSSAVAIGSSAGQISQGRRAVAIGFFAGNSNQNESAVAIGNLAGSRFQGEGSIVIGSNAGFSNNSLGTYTNSNYIAIGKQAGQNNQSTNSIAIGWLAGLNNTAASSIILNALGSALNSSNAGFYVAPVRFLQGSGNSATVPAKGAQNVLGYSISTSEIFYSDSLQVSSIYTQFGFSSNGNWTTSDSNVKENIVAADLSICYSNVSTLPLRRFNFINPFAEAKIDKTQVGFIAQEVSTIFPKSLVTTYDELTSTNIFQINYDQIQMAHYGATQLMMSTVSGQQKQINDLAATVSSLVAKVGL